MKRAHMAIGVLGLFTVSGCSVGNAVVALKSAGESRPREESTASTESKPVEAESATAVDLPFPDRTDPFTVQGHQTEQPVDESYALPQLRGFVEVDEPMAIFRYQGRSHLLKTNESLADWTIVEITPPQVAVATGQGRQRIFSIRDDQPSPQASVDDRAID